MNLAQNNEWWHYSWNPITGCTVGCGYCYARAMSEIYPKGFPQGMTPTFHERRLDEPRRVKKPSRIFTASQGDLWDLGFSPETHFKILRVIAETPQHRYIILTKQPLHIGMPILRDVDSDECYVMKKPDNLWLGVTVDRPGTEDRLFGLFQKALDHRICCCEPLLGPVKPNFIYIDWLIIGAQSAFHSKTVNCPEIQPDPEWVRYLLRQADTLDVPVFMKNNLGPYYGEKRREYPDDLKVR
jgi:protein gp37